METSTSSTHGRRITLLAIETSCDETAVAVLECERAEKPEDADVAAGSGAHFTVLGNALLSQIDIHREYGGVYPMIAKREHAKNLVPLLASALEQAGMHESEPRALFVRDQGELREILERESGLADALLSILTTAGAPPLDAIAVTAGPGLEPALWVGVNFAKALSRAWNVPLISVNHMEGHVCAALAQLIEPAAVIGVKSDMRENENDSQLIVVPEIELPLLSLLISGGHTELVLSKEWGSYELMGATRDDAVGEAFDKVARMLGLPYPGGPEVSKLAELTREVGRENDLSLPRPMMHDQQCDFSFSGLKTAVLYLIKGRELSQEQKEDIAREFEDAVADVLYTKTARALEESGAQTLALGGGVSANTHIQRSFRERLAKDFPHVKLAIPAPVLTTDNAIMIGMAGFYHAQKEDFADSERLHADGNRKLHS